MTTDALCHPTLSLPDAAATGWRAMRSGPWQLMLPPRGMPCLDCMAARLASHGWAPPVPAEGGVPVPDAAAGSSAPFRLWARRGSEPWSAHHCLPLPACRCGLGRLAPGTLSLGDAVSPLCGLVRTLRTWHETALETAQLPCTLVVAEVADLRPLGSVSGELMGAACAERGPAVSAALGEALERYSAAFQPDELTVCTARDLGEPFLQPDPGCFGGAPIGDEARLRWVRGQRIGDRSVCWVPAAAAYFPYVCHDDEPRRSVGSSEGLAAGPTHAAAVEHAVLEVIERDTFMRAWRWGAPRRRLDNPYPERRDLAFVAIGNRFGVPVVAAFSEGAEVPYAVAGLAARLDLGDALRAAAIEATGARALFSRVSHPGSRCALESRYVHATDPNLRGLRRAFLADAGQAPATASLSWERFVERVPDAVIVDVTTPDVAALGVHVVRAVLPGLFGFEPTRGRGRMGGCPDPIPY